MRVVLFMMNILTRILSKESADRSVGRQKAAASFKEWKTEGQEKCWETLWEFYSVRKSAREDSEEKWLCQYTGGRINSYFSKTPGFGVADFS